MNKFVIALLPLLAVANAGIYSAKWPEGEVSAKIILRSGHIGLQGVDSATHNPGYVPQLRTDSVEESSNLNLKADNEKETTDEENIDQAQVGLRRDLDEYVNIGYIQNHPPGAWQSWRYQPKRVRAVIIEETDAKPTGIVESPEAPVSTARTPELDNLDSKPSAIVESPEATIPAARTPGIENLDSKPSALPESPESPPSVAELDNLDLKPSAFVETPEASVSTSKPQLENTEQIADNPKQLRYGYIIPTYNYYGNRRPIHYYPSYQSATAVAQNAPGINFASSSANSHGLGNSAAVSQAVNSGGLQSAVSDAYNNRGSAIAAAQNKGIQSSSIAQAYNNRGHYRYVAPQYQSATATAANYN